MGSYSKILVAYDDSESSRNALDQALTRFHDGWIKVLAVVPPYEGDLELVGVHDVQGLLQGPRKHLQEAVQEIVGSESARVKISVEQGDAFERIIDDAEEESCNLIVMGRRGLHGLERMLMGSVTAKVIVHTDKDVLVVPRKAVIDWKNILVATDGSAFSDVALKKAMTFAQDYDGRLTAVSVVDMYPEYYADAPQVVEKMEGKSRAVLDQARTQVEAAGLEIDTHVLHGDPAEEITAFAKKNDAGILFLGSRGLSGLKRVFLGSVAEKVIGLSGCPVFVAKI
jgi:hypothetical protein